MINRKLKEPVREWVLLNQRTEEDNRIIDSLSRELGISKITAGLLYDREIRTCEAARAFIESNPCFTGFADPFTMSDMERACERIERAAALGEKTVVYGDYDVDGVTAVSVLTRYLREYGLLDTGFYIPSRIGEGYGLNTRSIDKLKEDGVQLIVTVDTGITAIEEIVYAAENGIDVVVTDHHEYRKNAETGEMELPRVPSVNPRRCDCSYPFKELAGVGVVFRLITALEMRKSGLDCANATKKIIGEYAELIAIGTVADVMPLYGENRDIVKAGLKALEKPRFVGTKALVSLAAGIDYNNGASLKKINTNLICFTLAPRINAVGRMGSASVAAELFMTEDAEKADEIAAELCGMNTLRQKEENDILVEALAKIESEMSANDSVIVLDDDRWHHGVIGIVASRLTEKYGLPSILVSFEGNVSGEPSDKDIGKGSGRSVKGLDLVDALNHCRQSLVKYGGHELAAGLTVERGSLDEFKRAINAYAAERLSSETETLKIFADSEITIENITSDLAMEINLLEPFGQANPKPQFILKDATVKDVIPLKEGKHIKLLLTDGRSTLTALGFGMQYDSFCFARGDKIDLLGQIEINEFMGNVDAQLHIKDVRCSKELSEKRNEDISLYNGALHGGAYPEKMLPEREDFALIYRFLKKSTSDCVRYNLYGICARIKRGESYPYIKLRAVLDILSELSLITYTQENGEFCTVSINKGADRVDLSSSELFKNLARHAVR